jgi:DNA gyrase subunit B
MKPLIERGFLYIAQPPLYKVKLGRNERYLKDDTEFKSFLFEWAAQNTTLTVHDKALDAGAWKELLSSLLTYDQELERFSNTIEATPHHTHELITFLQAIEWEIDKFTKEEIVEKLSDHFKKYQISLHAEENLESEMSIEGQQKIVKPMVIFKELKKEWEIPLRFFTTEETAKLLGLYKPLSHLDQTPWVFAQQGKEGSETRTGTLTLCETIVKTAKSLITIQRYKGLGEMNPEQLWETTMDPAKRSFIQVTIEDALKADQWFMSLMGEDVEDRRSYIEKHAHFVRNLDV